MTEIEVYDTEKPADPGTGLPPVKARIRQTTGAQSRSNEKLETTSGSRTEAAAEVAQEYNGGTLAEATATATREPTTPSLWERIKRGAGWATAIMILAAAGWIIYKFKKK